MPNQVSAANQFIKIFDYSQNLVLFMTVGSRRLNLGVQYEGFL